MSSWTLTCELISSWDESKWQEEYIHVPLLEAKQSGGTSGFGKMMCMVLGIKFDIENCKVKEIHSHSLILLRL